MPIARSETQFRYLVALRMREAKALLREKHWAGAAYLAGYIAECALKALIASRQTDKTLPRQYTIHDIQALADASEADLEHDERALVAQAANWSHLLRYECKAPAAREVVDLLNACSEVARCILKKVR